MKSFRDHKVHPISWIFTMERGWGVTKTIIGKTDTTSEDNIGRDIGEVGDLDGKKNLALSRIDSSAKYLLLR